MSQTSEQEATFNSRHYALFILVIVYTFSFIDRQILVILQEPIKADLNLSDTQLGLLTGFAFALLYVTLGLPIARYADKNNRKKVTCFSKDNIMKFSDGIFHQVFNEIAKEYPKIVNEHYIVDIGTAKIANNPEIFDVVVTSNLFGDIISDVTAEISGSVGLAGSANVGKDYAMFEAIHGSAPDISGKNIANPSGLLNGAIMMLVHIGQGNIATTIENAWKKTIEDGIHTVDIYDKKTSSKKVGTQEFAEEVVKRLGQKPSTLKVANYSTDKSVSKEFTYEIDNSEEKTLVGVDIFVDMHVNSVDKVADKINRIDAGNLILKTIACKGLKLWPHDDDYFMDSDHWCCQSTTRGRS